MNVVLDRRCGDGEVLCFARGRVGLGARARRALFAGTALAGALAVVAPNVSRAQNATWTGATGDWNTNGNWSPASLPTGTATFDTAPTNSLTFSAGATIGTMQFSAGAPAYSFDLSGRSLVIDGSGIVNSSSNAPLFNAFGLLEFDNSATAGNATINNTPGATTFTGTSTAGTATITNSGGGLLTFTDTSSAANATIVTNNGSKSQFFANSNGGNAQFITNAGGIVDFSNTSGAAGNNQVTAGSIAGAGTYNLGANQLTVGGNDLSTIVSGNINDGGAGGGTGASLVKVGAGVLTLSGTNTYTGATTINAGTLIAGSNGALPSDLAASTPTATAVTVNTGATLIIADAVQADIGSLAGGGSVQIGTTDATTNLFIGAGSPATTTFSGALTGPGSLELDGGRLTLTGAGNNIGGDLTLCACDLDGLTIKGGSFVVGGLTSVEGGTLTVSNGGTLSTDALGVGSNMIITGAGSTVTVTTNTGIGVGGPGTLTISGGGTLNSQGATEIDSFVGTPSVTVTGTASTWNVSAKMTVGNGAFGGPGSLTISNGGAVNATGSFMEIGDQATCTSQVTVTGVGSVLNFTNRMAVGDASGEPGAGAGSPGGLSQTSPTRSRSLPPFPAPVR
jgi:autotransporter-associated beta strand protein/T5SS/PEP-CTERM-associated repeat protein